MGLGRADAPRLLAYCLMPSHWHLVVQATAHANLSTWMQWVSVTHTHRWHGHRHSVGEGPLYQGRFKSFPVASDEHFLILCRYVEANPLRAGLVPAGRAQDWRWGSLGRRQGPGIGSLAAGERPVLADWPVTRPGAVPWLAEVNGRQAEAELERVRKSVARGCPLGGPMWVQRTVAALGLETTLRPRGRPRKAEEAAI